MAPKTSARAFKDILRPLIIVLFASICLLGCELEAGSAPAWALQTIGSNRNADLERETIPLSPAQLGRRYASQLFNGRHLNPALTAAMEQQVDMFQCVDASRQLFDNFKRQYNRSFYGDSTEELNRLSLFETTLKRTIMINRIVQEAILNQTNYDIRPETIRNYYFISPTGAQVVAPWYADVTDCELGLIKYIVFDIIYLIERNELAMAYKAALDNNEFLPLLNEDGFEQLANILLVRLHDRFKGDEMMNKLFQWPTYMKKLAGYAYSRRQISEPNFNAKLPLIAFAYPQYFKDLKYNAPAANRTGDNVRANQDHERFNKFHGRRFVDLRERNRRLVYFRQRWSLINLLNEDKQAWMNATGLQPDWQRASQYQPGTPSDAWNEKLRLSDDDWANQQQGYGSQNQLGGAVGSNRQFRLTQFSDLSDAEFVAYLTNDFGLIDNNKDSANFIDNNFPIRQLDAKFRAEIAAELELRRALQLPATDQASKQVDAGSPLDERKSLTLAKQVVDELISDVGLPIGAVFMNGISEEEHYSVFNKVARFFKKPYEGGRVAGATRSRYQGEPNESELADEQRRRYDQFKLNYGRFKAWFIKEGWQLDEDQLVAMLRLADLEWREIKLILFKVCCLTDENVDALSANNATIMYWGSNNFMCQPLSGSGINANADRQANEDPLQQQQQSELTALELYYYYSVHFNKHHVDMSSFYKRFAIFRHNIDQIRRHSCTRALTVYRSLKVKNAEALNNMDVTDPRRSYLDDINLDRYRYFSVPKLNELKQWTDGSSSRLRSPAEVLSSSSDGSSSLSRAGISYRREAFFASLLERAQQRANIQQAPSSSYADRLFNIASDNQLATEKYRLNGVSRIYELVMERYRYCMRTMRNIELSPSEIRRQRCHSAGPLADHAVGGWNLDNQINSAAARLQLQQEDQCAFYWLGLESWNEGLMKQHPLSPKLIEHARCNF